VESLLVSLVTIAIAEIGDKTQLLSLVLAARYRRPWPISIGVLAATLANHLAAGEAGVLLTHWLSPPVLRWLVGLSFMSVAIWALFPDKLDEAEANRASSYGVFVATLIAFFLAEMGDRTQIATAMLGATYQPLWQVVAGTTSGMLVANVPVVFLGARFAQHLPLRMMRVVAAIVFSVLGAVILLRGLSTQRRHEELSPPIRQHGANERMITRSNRTLARFAASSLLTCSEIGVLFQHLNFYSQNNLAWGPSTAATKMRSAR